MFWDHKVLPCMAKEHGIWLINALLVSLWQIQFISFTPQHGIIIFIWVLSTFILFIQPCTNADCLYLHEFGPEEDSFTKDEIITAYTRYFCIVNLQIVILSMLVLKHDILLFNHHNLMANACPNNPFGVKHYLFFVSNAWVSRL